MRSTDHILRRFLLAAVCDPGHAAWSLECLLSVDGGDAAGLMEDIRPATGTSSSNENPASRAAASAAARIQKHTAHIGDRTYNGTSTTTPEQLDLFNTLSLPRPA